MKNNLDLLLVLVVAAAIATPGFSQNLAVKFYGVNPENIPTNWPSDVREIGASTTVRAGETLMSVTAYRAYVSNNLAAYRAYEAAKLAVVESRQTALRNDLSSSLALLRTGLTNWATLTDTQKQNLLRVQIQTLLTMGELGLVKLE